MYLPPPPTSLCATTMFPVVTEPQSISPWDLYSTSQSLTLYSTALWPYIVLLVLSTAILGDWFSPVSAMKHRLTILLSGLFTALVLFASLCLVYVNALLLSSHDRSLYVPGRKDSITLRSLLSL